MTTWSPVRARRALPAVLVALALGLAGCTATAPDRAGPPATGDASPGTPNGSSPATSPTPPVDAAPPAFVTGPCPFRRDATGGADITCGTLTVPQHRDRPDGPTLQLAVAIVRSANPAKAPDPVVYLEGGPGGSALAAVETWTTPPSPLLADRDVILVDQRGTGYSEPRLTCDRETRSMPADTDGEVARLFRACRDRLASSGVDLGAFSTAESAADVDDLRRALGLAQVDLFGVSYGTRLALRVLADHPDGIRSIVLDSVYPVGVRGYEEQPTVLWQAMANLFAGCRADPGCDAAYPDLEARLTAAVERLDRSPAPVTVTDPDTGEPVDIDLTGADVVDALAEAMYLTAAIPELPKALDLVARGDAGAGYDLLQTAGATTTDAGEPPDASRRPDDSDALFYAVECAEEAPANDPDAIAERSASIPPAFREDLVVLAEQQLEDCAAWAIPPRPSAETRSDVPALLLAGTYDPVTAPAWAEQAARGLSRARVVVVDGAGHAVIDAGPCPQQLVVSFLRAPTGDGGPTCSSPPRFVTS